MTDPADDMLNNCMPNPREAARYAHRCLAFSRGALVCKFANPLEMLMDWTEGTFIALPEANWQTLYPLYELDALPAPAAVVGIVVLDGVQCTVIGRTDRPWPPAENNE